MTARLFGSIRARLLLLIALAVLPAFAFLAFSGIEQRRHASETTQAEALRLVRIAAAQHTQLVDQARLLLAGLALHPTVISASSDVTACTRLLRSTLEGQGGYTNLAVIRPDGEFICSHQPFE